MPGAVRGNGDPFTDQVLAALHPYKTQHPGAEIQAYRRNSASIRVRVIDPDFSGISRAERHEIIWRYLEKLPEAIQSQVSLLVLLTPSETTTSIAKLEFENPAASRL
jgi:hypothetical protein